MPEGTVTTPAATVTPAAPVTPVDAASAATPEKPALPAPPKAAKAQTPLQSRNEARAAAAAAAKERLSPPAEEAKVETPSVAITSPAIVPAAKVEAASATPVSPATPTSSSELTPSPAAQAAADRLASAGRKVEIDPRHPVLGGRKLESVTVQNEQEEQFVRGLMNATGTRRTENEALKARVVELENERMETQKRLISKETLETVRQEWEGTPQYQQALTQYNEIKGKFGDEVAMNFWRGAQAEFQKLAQTRITEKVSEAQSQDNDRRAQAWVQETRAGLQEWLPEFVLTMPELDDWYGKAVKAFNAELELGNLPHVTSAESMREAFKPFFQSRLAAQSKIHDARNKTIQEQAAKTQRDADEKARVEKDREDLKKAAIDEYLKNEAVKRAASPPHPMGSLAAASRSRTAASETSETTPPPTNQSPHQNKQAARQAARDLARQRFNGA